MKVLSVTSRCATFELENTGAYYAPKSFTVSMNGQPVFQEKRNVFSLFSLTPDTRYSVCAGEETVEFSTEKEPSRLNVRDFRAVGDGAQDDTPAFQAAIACLPKGGVLYVPEGTYFLKPIFLKSDMTLYLDKGAVLLGHPDRNVYPTLPGIVDYAGGSQDNFGTWQGEEVTCFASLITAVHCRNITIAGEGTINCNAKAGDWYQNHRKMRIAWRPRGIFFNRCENVRMVGIKVCNTPSWNVHPYFCEKVELYDLKLENEPSMPTTDGIDPDTCRDVKIVGVDIDVGDDCIAIKSGTIEQAKKYRLPCRDITIRNCLMRAGHGGVVLGSELSGGIENVHVSRCLFQGTDRGLRIKTRRGRGRYGTTGNITFRDIVMENVAVPFVVNMYYNMGDETGHTEYVWTTEKLPVDELTPQIGSFCFENMVCTGVKYIAGAFYGLPEAPIEAISFKNVSFSYDPDCEAGFPDMKEINEKVKNKGLYFQFVEIVKLEDVAIDGCIGDKVICEGVDSYEGAPDQSSIF